jgi:hypothetical protein
VQHGLVGVRQQDAGGVLLRLDPRSRREHAAQPVLQPGGPHLEPVFGVAGQQLGRGQVGDDLAVAEHRDPAGQLLGDGKLMGGQQDRLALVAGQPGDPVLDRAGGRHVQPDRRLVQQQDRRVGDQRRGDRDLLLHATGVGAHGLVAAFPQAQLGEQPLRAGPDLAAAQALQAAEVQQVLPGRQRPVHVAGAFQHRADLPHRGRTLPGHVVAVQPDRARRGQDQPAQHLDRGRLAGAVGAEQADHLPWRHAQRDVADGREQAFAVPVALGQAGQLDGRMIIHCPSTLLRFTDMQSVASSSAAASSR